MSDKDWWKKGVFYQIYPRSYLDRSGDGIGDLTGITDRLEYIASLGIDGVWISPFFLSPMADFGYDVSDYRTVDPIFGSNEDFETLLEKAHELGLKIIIDMVLSHTSIQHSWFEESRSSKDNAKSDWYIWVDAKEDGSPPNNWQSVFGGPAWTFDTKRGQYYMHNFLKEQPDLNFHNPIVQKQLLSECEYWLERGVDGFRLDTVNFYFHDKELRDNPTRPKDSEFSGVQIETPYPYIMQQHVYDKSQPENIAFLASLRELMDRYGATMTLGEIGDDDPYKLAKEYTDGDKLLHTTRIFYLEQEKMN
ncbi:MAG: alpha-amylase family glycosyl hydrolase [Pseudomonadota bacterium]